MKSYYFDAECDSKQKSPSKEKQTKYGRNIRSSQSVDIVCQKKKRS